MITCHDCPGAAFAAINFIVDTIELITQNALFFKDRLIANPYIFNDL